MKRKVFFILLGMIFSLLIMVKASLSLGADFVQIATLGKGVDKAYAQKAAGYMNQIFANGCLEKEIKAYKFTSRNNYLGKSAKDSIEVYNTYVKNAPYPLHLKWYSKRFSRVIGYTYNTDVVIYSNTRMMGSAKDYANHLFHELSHQDRAGGFVHWTVFEGSVPYGLNDIAAKCFKAL